MAELLEKRQALHSSLAAQKEINSQLQSQLGQMQALANIGLVSAMIAHEMNNILTPLTSYAELSMGCPDDRDLANKTIEKTAANSMRAAKILESMLAMANGKMQEKKQLSLQAVLDEIFSCMARDFSKDNIDIRRQFQFDITVFADNISFQQVLMNLIINARDAMLSTGGVLTIEAERADDFTVVRITDTGCGIREDNIAKVFEPFFTTKTKKTDSGHSGAGLGLAFCKTVIDEHQGRIEVNSAQGNGTTFTIALPNDQQAS